MTTPSLRRRASGRALIVLLGLQSALGPFSNDTLLPNFSPIQSTMARAAVVNTAYHSSHPATLPVSVLPIFVYTSGLGIAMPSIMLLELDLMPQRRGLASSLVGFAQCGFSAVLAGVDSRLV